jgi:uridine kinase
VPVSLPFNDALEHLARHARSVCGANAIITLGITGPVGAGKSTLASRLAVALAGSVISTDHYLPDYEPIPEHERDDPRHSDLPRLALDLASLRAGRATVIPVWSFHSHKREGERVIHPSPVLIVEGIHALHATVRGHLDVKVYVEAAAATRWARWEYLESSGQRGWGVEKARGYFNGVAEPTFAARAAEYRGAADLVVENDSVVTG